MFTFGADPEIFVKKNGLPVSAHGLIEGTKKKPFKTSNGAVQVDGMALEFNIDPSPQHDFEKFNENIVKTIRDLREMVPGYNFSISPVQDFPEEMFAALPDEAKELGCDPDYNAYTLEENPMPDGTRLFRTAAGHLHVGWGADIPVDNDEHKEICAGFVKMLDATVGMYMTFIDREPRRRELYGKAGAMRVKPYGVEYRTPSNLWLINKNRRRSIWTLLNKAISNKRYGYAPSLVTGITEDDIQRVINTGDFATAKAVLDVCHPYESWWQLTKKEMDALTTVA